MVKGAFEWLHRWKHRMVLVSPNSGREATLQFPGAWFLFWAWKVCSWFLIQVVAGTPEIQKQTEPTPTSLTVKPEIF